uniref:Uncharacterized protein n=1 Tax=Talaromyces marneffei PM1 TaxID=1077442 RepID=A0A093V7A0_TALMA
MSAAIEPSGQRYALFIKPIEVELEKYINTSDYHPTNSQLAQFERNCALLKPAPDLASIPLTSRKRYTSAQSNIQKLYEELDADLFILCTLATPKTKLASFDSSWISKLSNWWNPTPTPSRLSGVALELYIASKIQTHDEPSQALEVLSNDTNDSGLLKTTQTQSQIVVNASLEGVANVFGENMSYAVRKITVPNDGAHVLKAAVTMEFPDFNLVDCVMMLEIIPDYVEHLVRDLFGIEVETADVQYIQP